MENTNIPNTEVLNEATQNEVAENTSNSELSTEEKQREEKQSWNKSAQDWRAIKEKHSQKILSKDEEIKFLKSQLNEKKNSQAETHNFDKAKWEELESKLESKMNSRLENVTEHLQQFQQEKQEQKLNKIGSQLEKWGYSPSDVMKFLKENSNTNIEDFMAHVIMNESDKMKEFVLNKQNPSYNAISGVSSTRAAEKHIAQQTAEQIQDKAIKEAAKAIKDERF